jgi:hypothetical protein
VPDDVAELTELMQAYRSRSKAVPFRPIAAAYAEAANDLQELIAGFEPSSPNIPRLSGSDLIGTRYE